MQTGWYLWTLLAIPAAGAAGAALMPSPRAVLRWTSGVVAAAAAVAGLVVAGVLRHGPIFAGSRWLFADALSALHLGVLMIVFLLSSFYAIDYFEHLALSGEFTRRLARRYGALWLGALGSMIVVLLSNNLGILWVGIELSTLLTAFLICVPVTAPSLEAMWKYLIMCSVGVAFAFVGTLLVGASASAAHLPASDVLLWTALRDGAANLNVPVLKVGFLFLLIGYGTKAGLAPMHNWLPDAHSQAPAPVSAVFSGILLNTALYCIIRTVPLVEIATGNTGWALEALALFGAVSVIVAAAFILFQHDAKRLLAYSSVEHIGIISLGVGLGGFGTFAAMFHLVNHSIGKTIAFLCAGRLGRLYGTNDMRRMSGALRRSPVWGGGLFVALLALIGVAPFAIFLSEFMIVKAAFDRGSWWLLVLFLVGACVVFIGVLRQIMAVAWGRADDRIAPERVGVRDKLVVAAALVALLVLGLWMPSPLGRIIEQAANIIGGSR